MIDFKDEYGGGWIGVDLDGTLAHYDGYKGPDIIGDPIPEMVYRVKHWISSGWEVRIFTARASTKTPPGLEWQTEVAKKAIAEWSLAVFGKVLSITCEKDYMMRELWDDRCVQVEFNKGTPVKRELKLRAREFR